MSIHHQPNQQTKIVVATDVADYLREFSAAVAADSWALDTALRAYRIAPNARARQEAAALVADLTRVVCAEVLSLNI